MARLTIKQFTSELLPDHQSYRLTLEVTSSEDIPKEVFVKQRFKNYKTLAFDDVFVCVATPVQIEDLPTVCPDKEESFFRDSKIDLISRNIDYLLELKGAILSELDKLVDEWYALEQLSGETTIVITNE